MNAFIIPRPLVVMYLAEHGAADTMTLSDVFGCHGRHMLNCLRGMSDKGEIQRAGRRRIPGTLGPPVMLWSVPPPPAPDELAQDGPDTAPMRQRRIAHDAWQRATHGRAAGPFDGLLT